ncbi:GNAT family N-acetyltransferase [Vagococcus xieshaowenii]|uniref:N-acetyltransferase n=1 Tax=Vagococcus xieshaowenii TaxID=2562451 RepID=A0AAJ5JKU0_9ENTE|nr:GNAT family N-acetyltransferase [Vagococcus xieshaowenii]QCA27939.1 N-acetyltransferase [Vagococcus xieshaowenii]TFZ40324.1 N-acetyltransferase [Vagococcus xieshaowenii]
MEINATEHAFHLIHHNEKIGEITFTPYTATIIEANHTFIEETYRGQDLGLRLVDALVTYARENKLLIFPTCPYVKKVFSREATYQDVWYKEN